MSAPLLVLFAYATQPRVFADVTYDLDSGDTINALIDLSSQNATLNSNDSGVAFVIGGILGASGDATSGTLTKTGAGSVTVQTLGGSVGRFHVREGHITLSENINLLGSGSTTISNNALNSIVGYGGAGSMTINNGAVVTDVKSNQRFVVGDSVSGNGTLNVIGAGSKLSIGDNTVNAPNNALLVGANSGVGNVNVTNGGTVATGFTWLGNGNSAAAGTITVDGAGSALTARMSLYVGNTGTGILNIKNGGSVQVGGLGNTQQGNLTLGNNAGSSGTVNVEGANSTLNLQTDGSASYHYIGYSGTGALNIKDNAVVNVSGGSTNLLFVGYNNKSSGALNIDNATLNVADRISIAAFSGSTGDVQLTNNAKMNASYLYIASNPFGDAYSAGTGTLTVESGSVVDTNYIYIGKGASGNGTLYVNGVEGSRGTITAANAISKNTGGTAKIIFDGGRMIAKSTSSPFASSYTKGDVVINSGGFYFDSNGKNVVIATSFVGSGKLVKQGSGFIALSGNSEHGGVVIEEGGVSLSSANGLGTGGSTIIAGGNLYISVVRANAGGIWLKDGEVYLTGASASDTAQIFVGSEGFIMDGGVINFSFTSLSDFDSIVASDTTADFALNDGVIALSLHEDFDYAQDYLIFDSFESGIVSSGIDITGYDSINYIAWISTDGYLYFTEVPEPAEFAALFGLFVLVFALRRRISL